MPLGSLTAVDEERGLFGGLDEGSGVMVEVEDERLKVLAKGARCVSLSSGVGQRWTRVRRAERTYSL